MNVGVVGLGFMGVTHLLAWRKLPGVSVVAVSARDTGLLGGEFSKVRGNFGEPFPCVDLSAVGRHPDWRELVSNAHVDAVDICLPTDLHKEVATAALRAGKHVLCEKPMALHYADCEEMLHEAGKSGRVLMIGHLLRFWPAYERLREFVQSGADGPVRSATFTRSCGLPEWSAWLPDEKRSGGAILDLLIHDLDQILLLFGPPAAVRAKALGEVDAITATLLYPRGPEVRLQGGWLKPGSPFTMGFQVRAERAQLELAPVGLIRSDMSGHAHTFPADTGDPFAAQLSYFQKCCELGQAPFRCPPEQSAAAVKLAHCLAESRRAGGDQIACEL